MKRVIYLLTILLLTTAPLLAAGCQGPPGPTGPQGEPGPAGPQGPQGESGPAADEGFILDYSVTSEKLASNAVTSSKISDGEVTTRDLDDESVTTDKIEDGAVTADKIADGVIDNSKLAVGAVMPEGSIIMWSGTIDDNGYPVIDGDPDENWHICDGTDGTPDLRDRFIVGAGGTYTVGDTGGSDSQTLTADQMPEHNHDFSTITSEDGEHDHLLRYFYIDEVYEEINSGLLSPEEVITEADIRLGAGVWSEDCLVDSGVHTHTVSGTTETSGSGQSFSIMPSYYALAYIMYVPD